MRYFAGKYLELFAFRDFIAWGGVGGYSTTNGSGLCEDHHAVGREHDAG